MTHTEDLIHRLREGFEAHINDCIESEGGLMQALQRDAAGDYVTRWVAAKFVTWQAASSKEREACAKVADQISDKYGWGYYGNEVDTADEIAEAIRARVSPQPVQKPVAWGVFEGNLHDMFFTQEEAREMAALKGHHAEVRPLYTTPPLPVQPAQEPMFKVDVAKRKWESLQAEGHEMQHIAFAKGLDAGIIDAWGKVVWLEVTLPLIEERNFCPRCGKRTADIHTCTPPRENT